MLINMLRILMSTSFLWSWLLVFPVSVGMQWNNDKVHGHSKLGSLVPKINDITLTGCQTNLQKSIPFPSTIHGQPTKDLKISTQIIESLDVKPCGRETYNQVRNYEECGLETNLALLPVFKMGEDHHVKHIQKKVTPRGSLDYVFDGGTASRYPAKDLPKTWYSSYSVSGWIQVQNHRDRQYIVSWSKGDTERRQNMGFYARRSHTALSFGFSQTYKEIGFSCLVKRKWKVHEKELKWHFFTLSFANCDVQFTLDGTKHLPTSSKSHLHAPDRHIQPKFVIGARWVGNSIKYDDYFHGQISGLILSTNTKLDSEKLDCLFQCTEQASASLKTISKEFTSETESRTFEHNQHLVFNYTNRNIFPIQNTCRIKITFSPPRAETTTSSNFHHKFSIQTSREQPSLTITGCQDNQGTRICADAEIKSKGCLKTVDSLTIISNELLEKHEKLTIPTAYIHRYKLTLKTIDKGLIVYGVASIEDYTHILKQIKLVNPSSAIASNINDITKRSFKVTASSYNGIIQSKPLSIQMLSGGAMVAPPQTTHKPPVKSNHNHYYIFGHLFMPDNVLPDTGAAKEVYQKKSSDNSGSILLVVIGSIFSIMFLGSAIVFTKNRFSKSTTATNNYNTFTAAMKPSLSTNTKSSHLNEASISAVYFMDDNMTPSIRINSSDRVSISNDPLKEILLKKAGAPIGVSMDGSSIYSDEEESDFDNDSIRQLEWDCLERNLSNVLNGGGDDRSSTTGSKLDKDEAFYL
ncbi:calsyntenin-1-like [Clytia hemisphaerica]